MNHLPLIIKREYLTKVKNKSFVIMTFLSPLIMIGLVLLVSYLFQLNNNKVRTISILDESGQVKAFFKDSKKTKYHILDDNITLENAKKISSESEYYGLLHVDNFSNLDSLSQHISFYSEDSPSLTLMFDLESKIEKELTNIKMRNQGIDINKIENSKISININQESFSGEKTSKIDGYTKIAFGVATGYLLFMFIIIYGNMIMRSVIEEKTSRIIEVIISSVKPVQLMLGKIIGTSLAGITQFTIWIIVGGVLIIVLPLILGIDMSQMQSPQQQLMQQAITNPNSGLEMQNILLAIRSLPLANLALAFILFFVSGYLLYSSLYAAIGAAVDNETDTQQFILPIIMPLVIAVYVGGFTVIEDPHGTVSTIFSFIPFTSPVVMLMRIPFGVPIWQQVVSLVILIGTFTFTVWLAAKIYRVGILMYGKKPSYKELIKWIKY
ncbi:ABC transporter permease [Pontimicrobium sp. MEBiC06410]